MAKNISYREESDNKALDTVRELCKELPFYVHSYVKSIQLTTTAKTRLEYTKDIKTFLEYFYEGLDNPPATLRQLSCAQLESITNLTFEEYLNYLLKYDKNEQSYTNGLPSIKRKLSSLRSFFTFLYVNDFISHNVILKVKIPKLREKTITRLDMSETSRYLDTIEYGDKLSDKAAYYHEKQKTRDLAIITLLLSSGIRVSECVGLDLSDVNLERSCLRVVRKGQKEAIVFFSDEASGYLMEYIEERKLITPCTGSETALFLSSRKKRISVRTVEVLVQKYAERATLLKHITPHKLRSTYASQLYEETGDIYMVAEALGHEDVSTTKKHYAQITEKRLEENRNRVSLRK